MSSPRTLARAAGSLYLAASVFFVFAGSVRGRVIDPGDGAATADHIRSSALLFRVGMLSDLMSGVAFLFTAMAFYLLLKHVNQLVAAAIVVFVALGVAVGWLIVLGQYGALTIATNAEYTKAFGPAGSDALVLLFVDLQRTGLVINEIVSGLWLLPLGYLVMRSGYFPKVLGVLLLIGGASWLAHFLVSFLAPDLGRAASFLIAGTVGELIFIVWLLVKGATAPPPSV